MPEAINAPTLFVVPAAAGTPAVASAAPGAGGLFGGFLAAALSVGGALAQGTAGDAPAADGATASPLLAGVSASLLADTPDEDDAAAEPATATLDGVTGLLLIPAATTPAAVTGTDLGTDATDGAATGLTGAIEGAGQGPAVVAADTPAGPARPGPATIADALAAVAAAPSGTPTATLVDDSLPTPAAPVPTAVAEAAATSAETALARLAALVVAAAPDGADPAMATGDAPASPAPPVAADTQALSARLAAVGGAAAPDALALPLATTAAEAAPAAEDAALPPATDGSGDESPTDRPVAAGRVTEVTTRPADTRPATGAAAAVTDPDPAAAATTTVTALAAASQDAVGDPIVDVLIDMVAAAKLTTPRDIPAEVVLRDAAVREAAERAPTTRSLADAVETTRRADAPARPVEDAASAVARSTVTRDTAGTALAAAIIGADPAMRPAASRSTRPAERADTPATAATGSANGAPTGGATVPPPSPGGLAAAATAFAARIKALGGERADSPTPAASSVPAAGTGAAGLPSGALSAPSALPGALALAQTGGQAAAAGATQAGLAGVLPQIAAEITRRAAAGETRFQIRLDPVELGRIDVRLSLDDAGEARAQLTVERRETYDLIARDQRGLERTLREAGYEVRDGSVQVTLRQNTDGGSGGGSAFERFAQQQQHGQNPHSGGQRGGDPSAGPVPTTPDASEADMLARLAAFASRPAGVAGRVDIRL